MIQEKEVERIFRQEFVNIIPNLIWQNDNGVYEVFDRYQIEPLRPGYQVRCSATDVGVFHSSRTAMSWCIADKFNQFTLAQELKDIDAKLHNIATDIAVRAAIAERSTNWNFRNEIGTKLETKIIHKKTMENQLTKCVNLAKYLQQRGFNNETARTGRGQSNKTIRQSI
jgi:hypothetical protein